MISAYPCQLQYSVGVGEAAVVAETARLEVSLFTPAQSDGASSAAAVELSVWAKSGRQRIVIPAEAALAAAGDVSAMLAKLYPGNVDATSSAQPRPN